MLSLNPGHLGKDGLLPATRLYCMCRDARDPHPNGCWRIVPASSVSGLCSFCLDHCKSIWFQLSHGVGGYNVLNGKKYVADGTGAWRLVE